MQKRCITKISNVQKKLRNKEILIKKHIKMALEFKKNIFTWKYQEKVNSKKRKNLKKMAKDAKNWVAVEKKCAKTCTKM